ncbi:VOC family protein [Mycobacterium interjectum]|uniref:VOC family protein n=1 Tax=Mycobacterium interjectum TaxID=33895 RepID=UPI00082FEF3E|nr:VOC family protein [Mycobacterium interjectum]MCV7088934.1 VOC family protein [Mycobacterium interjectum]
MESLVGRISGVSYLHIPAHDVVESAAFYRDVFGWQLRGEPDRPSFSDGTGHVIGRWVTDQAVAGADGLRAYIYVTDVDDTLKTVTAHGGRVVTPPYPEGTLRVALFADPAGNVVGIWQQT